MYLSGNILSTVPLKIYNLTTLAHRLLFQTSLNDVLDLHFGDIFSLYPGDYFLPPAAAVLGQHVQEGCAEAWHLHILPAPHPVPVRGRKPQIISNLEEKYKNEIDFFFLYFS